MHNIISMGHCHSYCNNSVSLSSVVLTPFLTYFFCRMPFLMMTSRQQEKISWVPERCTTANKMNWKPANRYFCHAHVHFYWVTLRLFNMWFSNIFSLFNRRSHLNLKASKNTRLRWILFLIAWGKGDFALIAVRSLKTRESHFLLSLCRARAKPRI